MYHADAVNPKTGAQLAFYYGGNYSHGVDWYLGTQLFTADGPVGSEHVVVTGSDYAATSWQYAAAYNPTTGGWFVAYPNYNGSQIIGQLLNADGSNSGSSFTIGTITTPEYGGIKINWNPQSKKFLVTYTSYDDSVMKARFVTGAGAVSGSEFTVLSGLDTDYCPMDTAYSTKSNTYLALIGGYCSPDTDEKPLLQLVSGSGALVGSSRYLSAEGTGFNYAASIAYNAKLNEFGAVWQAAASSVDAIFLQRINASNGANVGDPVEITPPEGMESNGLRPFISASPSGQYYLTANLQQGTSSYEDDWYSFRLSGTGQPVAGSFEDISNGVGNMNRPQNLYNPVTGQFLSTFPAKVCVPNVLSTTRSTRGGACTNTYNLYVNGGPGSPPGGNPRLEKAGTPGGTSLQVRVDCAGGGSCKIRLGGKLVGGSNSDKLKGKTVKVGSANAAGAGTSTRAKASRTVTLAYTSALIRQLAADGGGKIRVKASQVGGKSKTITVTVPSSVTG